MQWTSEQNVTGRRAGMDLGSKQGHVIRMAQSFGLVAQSTSAPNPVTPQNIDALYQQLKGLHVARKNAVINGQGTRFKEIAKRMGVTFVGGTGEATAPATFANTGTTATTATFTFVPITISGKTVTYEIAVYATNGTTLVKTQTALAGSPAVVTGLTASTNYKFQIRGVWDAGVGSSAYSAQVSATTTA